MKYKGLTDSQVQESREKYGSNAIPDSEPTTFWAEFLETFSDPMIKILLVIAAIMITMFILDATGVMKTGVAIYEPDENLSYLGPYDSKEEASAALEAISKAYSQRMSRIELL